MIKVHNSELNWMFLIQLQLENVFKLTRLIYHKPFVVSRKSNKHEYHLMILLNVLYSHLDT